MKYCGSCGKQIGDDFIFCPYCGAKTIFAVTRRTCPDCGAEIKDGQLFCPNCGTVQAQDSKKTVEVNNNINRGQTTDIQQKKANVQGVGLLVLLDIFCVITIFGIPVAIYGLVSLFKAKRAQTDYEASSIMKKATKVSFIGLIICTALFICLAL